MTEGYYGTQLWFSELGGLPDGSLVEWPRNVFEVVYLWIGMSVASE